MVEMETSKLVIDLLISKSCQPVRGYFMPMSLGITFIVRSCLRFCEVVSRVGYITLLNMSNFQTDLFDP